MPERFCSFCWIGSFRCIRVSLAPPDGSIPAQLPLPCRIPLPRWFSRSLPSRPFPAGIQPRSRKRHIKHGHLHDAHDATAPASPSEMSFPLFLSNGLILTDTSPPTSPHRGILLDHMLLRTHSPTYLPRRYDLAPTRATAYQTALQYCRRHRT